MRSFGVDRRVRAVLRRESETLASARQDGPQFPLRSYNEWHRIFTRDGVQGVASSNPALPTIDAVFVSVGENVRPWCGAAEMSAV